MILNITQLKSGYYRKEVLHGININMLEGEIVGIIGHNGAGKTTLLKTIFGLLPVMEGRIEYLGKDITYQKSSRNASAGISYVPQGSGVFPNLTVMENLMLGGSFIHNNQEIRKAIGEVFDLFPRLKERTSQHAGTLSGGERQMLAIGIGLIREPKLMMLDEPSLGLAPILVQKVMKTIHEINKRLEITILLVEQNVKQVIEVAVKIYVIKIGEVTHEEKDASKLNYEKLWKLF